MILECLVVLIERGLEIGTVFLGDKAPPEQLEYCIQLQRSNWMSNTEFLTRIAFNIEKGSD